MDYIGFKETKFMLEQLDSFLHANKLKGEFTYTCYPMRLCVTPYSEQIDFFTAQSEKDPTVTFILGVNAVAYTFDGELNICEDVFNRIKSFAKKLHYTWLQEYFAALIAEGRQIDTIEEYDEKFAEPSEY